MRLFFALWPPRDTARALAGWAAEVQRSSGGRLTREENIHVTLAFLGEADQRKACAAAESVRCRRFDLPIDTAKYWKHNKIVWVGPAAIPPGLNALVAPLHENLKASGFALEDRPFAAHVTLVRKAVLPGEIPPLPEVRWPADEFVLVQSVSIGQGSRYDIVQRFVLGEGGAR